MIIYQHKSAHLHQVPTGHPERPERMAALHALLAQDFADITRKSAPLVAYEALTAMHDEAYLQALFEAVPQSGLVGIDGDTYLSPQSLEAARRGAGAACAAVDDVLTKQSDTAFVAMRPPGHHAEPDKAMGFCFFSNAAIAARYAQEKYGLSQVAVLDFDVHHGNGTQACFEGKAGLYYASTHEMPLFPGTGQVTDNPHILNQPMRAHMDGTDMLAAWQPLIQQLEMIGPELIIISAGFDAHRADPLASLTLESSDFYEVTSRIMALAEKTAEGRVVSLLEGGYDLTALAQSTACHLRALGQFAEV